MKLPERHNSTAAAIDRFHENRRQDPRFHLGASIIGGPCARKTWYTFRWFSPSEFSGRMLRLFRRGALEEDIVVRDLEAIGCKVSGRQRWVEFAPFVSGSIDGLVEGIPEAPSTVHLLEIKTHNKKSFDELEKSGVKKSKPEHFVQMQMYMLGLGDVDRAMYFAVCKDDDRIYTERVEFDPVFAKGEKDKAVDIAFSKFPPRRVSENPTWFECKFCNFHAVCHEKTTPAKSCRSCAFGSPGADGRWHCGARGNAEIPRETEVVGCESYRQIAD